jgi:hypothetical protein
MLFTLSKCSDVSLVYDCKLFWDLEITDVFTHFSVADPRRFHDFQNCVMYSISVYYYSFCQSEIQYRWFCKYTGLPAHCLLFSAREAVKIMNNNLRGTREASRREEVLREWQRNMSGRASR